MMHQETEYKEWFPWNVLNGTGSFAFMILNQPLNEEIKIFLKKHWNSAAVRIAVDGGANKLREIFDENFLLPEILSGDFDSISSETLTFFKEKGTNIIHTPDQDETDFTKAIKLTAEFLKKQKLQVSSIIVLASNQDRLDHIFANLNTLYKATELISSPIFILGNNTLTWLLTVGSHKIYVPENMRNSNIGLIPLGKECTDIFTTGLKWNLLHDKMKFGGLVSTSNTFSDSDMVTVTTDTEIIWTMEVKIL